MTAKERLAESQWWAHVTPGVATKSAVHSALAAGTLPRNKKKSNKKKKKAGAGFIDDSAQCADSDVDDSSEDGEYESDHDISKPPLLFNRETQGSLKWTSIGKSDNVELFQAYAGEHIFYVCDNLKKINTMRIKQFQFCQSMVIQHFYLRDQEGGDNFVTNVLNILRNKYMNKDIYTKLYSSVSGEVEFDRYFFRNANFLI